MGHDDLTRPVLAPALSGLSENGIRCAAFGRARDRASARSPSGGRKPLRRRVRRRLDPIQPNSAKKPMDYSFSLANLRKIWDIQTRKGDDLFSLFPELKEKYEDYRSERKALRDAIRTEELDHEAYSWSRRRVREAKMELEKSLSAHLIETSQEIISDVEGDVFSWGLRAGSANAARQTYRIGECAKIFFADKQMQRNVLSILPRRPNSRNQIVSALVASLDNEMPKVVVRVDVKDFYENIDHYLLRSLVAKSRLNPVSKKLIEELLEEYETITGKSRGLPAGVGLSSKLSELFISQVDRPLREASNVLYYARYVDDIVVIFGVDGRASGCESKLLDVIRDRLNYIGLEVNESKESVQRLSESKVIPAFEFLGYSIGYSGGVQVKMSDRRLKRMKDRIELSLRAWSGAEKNGVNHGKRKLLLDRLKFLTGNTKLFHNKRNALVGIYFTNAHLTDPRALRGLDGYLKSQVSQFQVPDDLKDKILKLSFEEGFRKRLVYKFSASQMRRMVGVWRE